MIVHIRLYNQNNPTYSYGHSVRWVSSCFLSLISYETTPIHRFVYFSQLRSPSRGQAIIERVFIEEVMFDAARRYSDMETSVVFDGIPSSLGTGLSNSAGLRNTGNYRALDPRWSVPYARVDDDGNAIQRCQIYGMLSTYDINLNYDYVSLRNTDNLSRYFNTAASSSLFSEYWQSTSLSREIVIKKTRNGNSSVIPVSSYVYPSVFARWAYLPNLLVSKRVGVRG